MRKAAWLAAGAAVAGLVALRRSAGGREHVDLYFSDGSMVSLASGSEEAERLVPLAAEVLSAARG
jgi:hypothetical protein